MESNQARDVYIDTKAGALPEPLGNGDGPPPQTPLESALHKTGWNLMPLLVAIVIMNHLDRTNLAFASLTFNRDNRFDARIYSIGVAMFPISFCLFQVPANLIMVRVGFKRWLAFLLVAWGLVTMSFMFIRSPAGFFICRLLLGVFEAGAFPAMWWVISTFYPKKLITKPYTYLTIGIMVANILGAPLATGFLAMDGLGGLKGWQWLFLIEGIPAVLLGGITLYKTPSSVAEAAFLDPAERAALESEVQRHHAPGPIGNDIPGAIELVKRVLRNPYFYLVFFGALVGSTAAVIYIAYTPIIINNMLRGTAFGNATVQAAKGAQDLRPVGLTVVPYSLAAVLAYIVATSSQRRNELFYHVASCSIIAGVLLLLFTPIARASLAAGFIVLSLSLAFCFGGNGPGMALIARICKGREQIVALPMANGFAAVGGIIGPLVAGAIMKTQKGFTWVFILMGILLITCGCCTLILRFWVLRNGGLPDQALSAESQASMQREKSDVGPGAVTGAGKLCV